MSFVKFMLGYAGRALRVVAGAVIIWLAMTRLDTPWSWVVAAVGVVPILAGLVNFCLLGFLFGADLWGRQKGASTQL